MIPEFRRPLTWLAGLSGTSRGPSHGPAAARRGRILDGLQIPAEWNVPLVRERPPGRTVGEEAFRSLLATERARADRSGRPLPILLVSLKLESRRAVAVHPSVAAKLFAGLGEAVREADLIGWYREDQVAGAVLAACADPPSPSDCSGILRRVGGALHERLPASVAGLLQLRVRRLGPQRLDR